MIVLKEIEKIYLTKNSPQVVALKNINLTFESKGMVFITGKSGCGKSTLLNILGALDSCTSGSMIIENKNINEFTEKELDNYRNSYVGFVFQEFHVLNAYNVYDNIRLAKELQQEKISEKELDAYLEKVSLTNLGKRKMNELSGGQKQRIAILRALIKNPRIILADEPTGNLDKINSKQIFGILKEISQEKLVIIVTHDLEAAQKYADRIIELKDGEIINDTKPTLNPEKTTLTLKESHLPFLFALKLAWNNLKRYPKKCILTIILFFISLLCCILLINSSLFNSTSLAIKLMNLNENYNIEVHKINYVQNTKWKEEWQTSEDQYLKNIYSGTTNPIYELYDFTTPLTFYLNTPQEPSKLFPTTPNITSYVEIKDPKILTNLTGSIPTSSNEIVIHEYLADYIINYGIKEKNGSWIPQNEEELLSKTHPIYLGDNEVYISGILKEETSYTEESLEDETTYAAYQNYIQKANIIYVKGFTNEVKLNQTKESTLNQFSLASDHQQKLSFTALDTLQENESLLTIDALILGNSKFKEAHEEYLNTNPLSTEEERKLWANNYLKQYQTECNLFFQDFLNYQNIPITVKIIGIADENILSSSLVEKYMTTGKRKTGVLIHEENSHTLKKLLSNLNFQVTFLNVGENPYEVSSNIISITNEVSTLYNTLKKGISFLALAFTAFTFLLLLNIVDDTVRYSKKEIGVLRALGTSKKDIFKIFAIETSTITLLSYILSFIGWFILITCLNNWYSSIYSAKAIAFYTSIYTPILTLLLSLGLALCITLLTLEHVNKLKPIKLINTNKN